ncbi:hypothetical protein TNIN_233741 [Trichonephila inaurata madagascariensis]|uniref:Uncharacterized protein n=1 Tax=Trichonephila inaurata madagascariensis TaxID=2747483 RepID=A0A8X6YUE7_9ARAC|nr:hypothetical protein TNIN_233741 [Trichonephila inaurata madagascariensis]
MEETLDDSAFPLARGEGAREHELFHSNHFKNFESNTTKEYEHYGGCNSKLSSNLEMVKDPKEAFYWNKDFTEEP